MSIRTVVRLADPFGQPLAEIADFVRLDYVLNCTPGGLGVLEVELPISYPLTLLRKDARLTVWRSLHGRPPALDNGAVYLLTKLRAFADRTVVQATHATSLLARRIVAYAADSAYTAKSGAADDLIKAFWRENAGASIVAADRDGAETQADISAYVTTQADLTQGPTIAKMAARRNLLEVARELAEAAMTAGTYVTFEIYAPTESTLELRTYTTQRGVDRRAASGNPLILSEARENLAGSVVEYDYTTEATATIAGGSGERAARLIATALDATRMAASPFGRAERFLDYANVDDASQLQDEADAGLRAARPVVVMSGEVVETPGCVRGLDFDLGDLVTIEQPYTATQFDARIEVVRESITRTGRRQQIGVRTL